VFATLKVLGTVLEQLTKEIPVEVGYVLFCIFLIFVGMQTFKSSLAMFFFLNICGISEAESGNRVSHTLLY
jgi:hypothetical protein